MHFYHPISKVLFVDIDKQTARENGLYKSISALTHMIENPALSEYALNQLVLACLKLQMGKGESVKKYTKKVIKESVKERNKAAKIGSIIHDKIEKKLNNIFPKSNYDKIATQALTTFMNTFKDAEILAVEENYICHTHKFGCKVDLLFEHDGKICLLDWKTNKFRNNKYQPYESNAWQLAGQSLACADNGIKVDEWYNAGINVDPKSKTYGECQIVSWRKKNGEKKVDISRGFEIIPLLSKIWDIQNNFEVTI